MTQNKGDNSNNSPASSTRNRSGSSAGDHPTSGSNISNNKKPQIEALLAASLELSKNNDYTEEALALNSRIVELEPSQQVAFVRLARCLQERGEFEAAAHSCQQALKLNPANRSAQNRLEQVNTEWKLYKKAAAITSRQEAFSLGVQVRKEEQAGQAIAYLWRAIELSTTASEWKYALVALAAAYRSKGDSNSLVIAQKLYERVLVLYPGDTVTLTGLAAVHKDRGDHSGARQLYQQVLNQHPTSVHALKGVGAIYYLLGDRETGRRRFGFAYYLEQEKEWVAAIARQVSTGEYTPPPPST